MTPDHCIACGRRYSGGGSSKPRWAFDASGRLVGTVHASHAKNYLTSGAPGMSLETARFAVWLLILYPRPEHGSDADYAWSLGISEEPQWPLSESQEHQLFWWARPEGLAFGEERLAAIRECYRTLIERYQVWRAGITDPVTV